MKFKFSSAPSNDCNDDGEWPTHEEVKNPADSVFDLGLCFYYRAKLDEAIDWIGNQTINQNHQNQAEAESENPRVHVICSDEEDFCGFENEDGQWSGWFYESRPKEEIVIDPMDQIAATIANWDAGKITDRRFKNIAYHMNLAEVPKICLINSIVLNWLNFENVRIVDLKGKSTIKSSDTWKKTSEVAFSNAQCVYIAPPKWTI